MKTVVFGAKGQLGRDLCSLFSQRGEAVAADLPEMDIADFDAVAALVNESRPSLIINAAAYTDVERAEDDRAGAFSVNEIGAGNIARAAAAIGAPVVYYSTDFVFDGTKGEPYLPEDTCAPLSAYGESKLAGESATREANARHCIIRTAWLYGPGGNNFVEKILRAAQTRCAKTHNALTVVEDEVGSPTYTADLAEATAALSDCGAVGVYHVVNRGACSRYELAAKVVELGGLEVSITPCSVSAFPMKARRPLYSVLSNAKYEKQTGRVMSSWQDALARYMQRRGEQR